MGCCLLRSKLDAFSKLKRNLPVNQHIVQSKFKPTAFQWRCARVASALLWRCAGAVTSSTPAAAAATTTTPVPPPFASQTPLTTRWQAARQAGPV